MTIEYALQERHTPSQRWAEHIEPFATEAEARAVQRMLTERDFRDGTAREFRLIKRTEELAGDDC